MKTNKKYLIIGILASTAVFLIAIVGFSNDIQTRLLGKGGGGTAALTTEVDGNDAIFKSQDVPTTAEPGETLHVSFTMQNYGVTNWTESANYQLKSVGNQAGVWSTEHVTLDAGESIEPMSQKQFSFVITAPNDPGTYTMQWQMAKDSEYTFGQKTKAIEIVVGSTTSPLVGTPVKNNTTYVDFPDGNTQSYYASFGCSVIECNSSGCRCYDANTSVAACTTNADCSTEQTCTNGQCVNTTTGTTVTPSNITGSLALTAQSAVYDVFSPKEGDPVSTKYGPQASVMVFDAESGTLYTNDHVGVYAFYMNALNNATVKPLELLKKNIRNSQGKTTNCLIKPEENYVSNCVAYSGDTGGYESPRAHYLSFLDKNIVSIDLTTNLTTHNGSRIIFSDVTGDLKVIVEMVNQFLDNANNYPGISDIRSMQREGGGIAIFGKYSSKGLIMDFMADGKQYGLFNPTGSTTFDDLKLVDLSNPLSPADLGNLSQHPVLRAIISNLNGGKFSQIHNMIQNRFTYPERIAVVMENNENVIYDYQDPTNIKELYRWTSTSAFTHNGLPTRYQAPYADATLAMSNGVLYVIDHQKKEVWGVEIGSGDWTKKVTLSEPSGYIYDGKVFTVSNIAGMYRNQNGPKKLSVYDLENNNWMMQDAELFIPDPGTGAGRCTFLDAFESQVGFGVTAKEGKYYVYLPMIKCSDGQGSKQKTYIWGYELSTCSGAGCVNVTGNNGNTCVPSCSGKSCGADDGCGSYCVNGNSCQNGFQCLPDNALDFSTTQPSCMCPFGSPYNTTPNAQCTPGERKYTVKGVLSDGRCMIKEELCSGVVGCNYWELQTSLENTYWKEDLESQYPSTIGIEQCANRP